MQLEHKYKVFQMEDLYLTSFSLVLDIRSSSARLALKMHRTVDGSDIHPLAPVEILRGYPKSY